MMIDSQHKEDVYLIKSISCHKRKYHDVDVAYDVCNMMLSTIKMNRLSS